MRIYKHHEDDRRYVLFEGDYARLLNEIPDEAINLTVTSPPYCMGKAYEKTTRVDDFAAMHEAILPEIVRVTAPGGSICWQVGYHVKNGSITPLDFLVHQVMSGIDDMNLRNRIIWRFGFGLNATKRFSGRHEVILWYTKGPHNHFDLDSVRVPQKYPGKTHYRGKKRGKPSCNPLGKNPSDVWDIPNVKARHVERTEHPCQFPVAIAQRLVRALTRPDDRVLDPFVGSGTTGVASILEGRRFTGAEMAPSYYVIAKERMKQALRGTISYRPHDKPVMAPNPKSKVARSPIANKR